MELIRKVKPGVIILDVKLDILSGFQVIDQVRSPANVRNQDVWRTPVLMTTFKVRGRDKQYAIARRRRLFRQAASARPVLLARREGPEQVTHVGRPLPGAPTSDGSAAGVCAAPALALGVPAP